MNKKELKPVNVPLFGPELKFLPKGPTYVLSLNLKGWDEWYNEDIETQIGFDLTDYTPLTKLKGSKERKRADNGIFSGQFGSELSDDITVSDRFSCTCKNLRGKYLLGEICPECHTPVIYFNSEILKTGWFTVNAFRFIQPHFYQFLSLFIGPGRLKNIIYRENKIDKDGLILKFEKEEKESDKTPFDGIGLLEFQKRFHEILEFYYETNKKAKQQLYDFLLENEDKIFINHIPVYSLNLRPFVMKKNNVRYADINKKLMVLSTNLGKLNKKKEYTEIEQIKMLPMLYDTQVIINEIYDLNMNLIVGKDGHIRNKMISAKVNNSGRSVIIPSSTPMKINEVKLPYLTFLELSKFHIINILCKIDNCTIAQAEDRWFRATYQFDKKIYQIMDMLIKKSYNGKGIYIDIIRNPTLQFGSKLLMKIATIKEDINDVTMTVSNFILGCIAGDYDGETNSPLYNDNLYKKIL